MSMRAVDLRVIPLLLFIVTSREFIGLPRAVQWRMWSFGCQFRGSPAEPKEKCWGKRWGSGDALKAAAWRYSGVTVPCLGEEGQLKVDTYK